MYGDGHSPNSEACLENQLSDLRKENKKLTRQLSEAKKDSLYLDWLGRDPQAGFPNVGNIWYNYDHIKDLRQAIQQAIEREEKK